MAKEARIPLGDLKFLFGCVLDLADCLDDDAREQFESGCGGCGIFVKEDIRAAGNLIKRADDLRSYATEMSERYEVILGDE